MATFPSEDVAVGGAAGNRSGVLTLRGLPDEAELAALMIVLFANRVSLAAVPAPPPSSWAGRSQALSRRRASVVTGNWRARGRS